MFWDRRGARGSRRLPHRRKSLFRQVLALAATRPVFTADYYAVDGVTGKVASFIDWNDPTHLLQESTSARQCAIPAGHADFANKLCATCDGNQAYGSNRSAAYWGLTSDGVSCETFSVFTPTSAAATNVLYGTTNVASTPGQSVFWTNAGGVQFSLYKSGGSSVGPSASIGAISVGTPTYIDIRLEQAGSNQYELRRKSSLISSGNYSSAPTSGAANNALFAFANSPTAASLPANMRARDILLTFPALSSAQRAVVQQYIQQTYGIAP